MKVIKLGKRNVTALPGMRLKIGPVIRDAGVVFGELPKGESRRLRKALRAAGHTEHSGATRI